MNYSLQCSRRRFLIGGTGAVIGGGLIAAVAIGQEGEALPEYVSWKDAADVIVHSPQTI